MANIKVPLISRSGLTTDGGSVRFENTDYMLIPKGSDAQRPPSPSVGMIRNNTTGDAYEAYHKGRWWELAFKTYWNIVTANTTITNGYTSYGVFVGNITSSITVTLPLSPKKDDRVVIVDGMRKFSQYPLTIGLNTNKYQGTTNNIVLNSSGSGVSLCWSGDSTVGWVLESSAFLFDSPNFSGTPTVPTAAVDTNTTQVASTAFVIGQAGSANPLMNGTVAVGTSTRFSRQDHVHPTDTTRAPLASPAFTGIPTAPTAAAGTNTTQIATTSFVQSEALVWAIVFG